MPTKKSTTGSELFIVDNTDEDWKVLRYLHDWCQLSKSIDIATGYFEIGGRLADAWPRYRSRAARHHRQQCPTRSDGNRHEP
jgi:hypothetical protein